MAGNESLLRRCLQGVFNAVVLLVVVLVSWHFWNRLGGDADESGSTVFDFVDDVDQKSEDELRECLWDPNSTSVERNEGMAIWAQMGHRVIPSLLDALDNRHPFGRRYVVLILGKIGPEARETIPLLLSLCHDQEHLVRMAALESLARIGVTSKSDLAQIADLLADESQAVRHETKRLLSEVGLPAIGPLCRLIGHENSEARLAAIEALKIIGFQDEQVHEAIRTALNDENPNVRVMAFGALGEFGQLTVDECRLALRDDIMEIRLHGLNSLLPHAEAAGPAVDELVELFHALREEVENDARREIQVRRRPDWNQVARMHRILEIVSKGSRRAATDVLVRDLVDLVDDPRPVDRALVAEWLPKISSDRVQVLEALHVLLKDLDRFVVMKAAESLRVYAPESAQSTIGGFAEVLLCGRPGEKMRAIAALRGFGSLSRAGVRALAFVVREGTMELQPDALATLGALGSDAAIAVPALVERLRDDRPRMRVWRALVVQTLGEIGPAAAPAVPELMRIIRRPPSRDYGVGFHWRDNDRMAAIIALGKIGTSRSDAAIPVLIEVFDALSDRDEAKVFRSRILETLRQLAQNHADHRQTVAGFLISRLDGDDPYLRAAAIEQLGYLTELHATVLPVLRKLLQDGHAYVQVAAIRALARFGSQARPVVPELEALVADPQHSILIDRVVALEGTGHNDWLRNEEVDHSTVAIVAREAMEQIETATMF